MHPRAYAFLAGVTFWGLIIFGLACCDGAI
jgi:hypothetical protein